MAIASLENDDQGQPRFPGCSNIRDFAFIDKLGEGTFGMVYKARSKKDNSVMALKKILMHHEKEGFPITAIREIKLLKALSHPNILQLREMAVERSKGEGRKKPNMYMVMPYMEHDLSGLLENPDVHFTEPQIKCYLMQLLEGLRYLHANCILHRDMKAANLLISNEGILQIADFGLARPFDEPPPQPGKGGGEAKREYTALVVTRWYRPPELLLQLRRYTTAIDMWGAGCVFGEMFKGKPILSGNTDLDQARLIFNLVGTPTEENMPGWSLLPSLEGVKDWGSKRGNLGEVFKELSPTALSLLSELLRLDWRKRINAIDALKHPYFTTPPLPARPGDIPAFKILTNLTRRRHRSDHLCPLHLRVALPIPLPTEDGLALDLEVPIPAVASRVRPVEVGRMPQVLEMATRTGADHSRLRETMDFLRGLLYRLAHHGMGHRQAGRKGETTNDVIDPIRAAPVGDLQAISTRTFLITATLTSVCAMLVIQPPNRTQNGAM
ncbi:uncharacterized protein N7477_009234 [Penicillium maclennaniae]|uniref:uncharacterized protein n=1 Tax=Penicillium maclennaniae TaxID=1343394 RepID=UPI0025416B75|nr:uncharacterized protein N7477_009234 [Penicillium maclennaniae]KAJ5661618.1 hypothetical protein N7477_009234 [Penicillium maclennaniae]